MTTVDSLPASLDSGSATGNALAAAIRHQLDQSRLTRIGGLPPDVPAFIDLVSRWGEPLSYYGAGDPGAHDEHPAVHRVRHEQGAASRGELHALDGPLATHSAQSLRDPRPPYFAMLMIDPGWQDGRAGENGESVLVEWRRAIEALARHAPDRFAARMRRLTAEVPFPDGSEKAILYPLPDARSEFDLGVRMKYELVTYWQQTPTTATASCEEALLALLSAAATVEVEIQLSSGECLIVDNNRWGHGRRSVRGTRKGAAGLEVNPRELWSVTLG